VTGLIAAGAMLGVPAEIAAVLGLAAHIVLTGGIHLDGLSDTADGVLGGWTRERRLEIMRDSRIGAFGVIALILVLLAKFGSLTALCRGEDAAKVVAAMVAAAALARYAMVLSAGLGPYARSGPGTGRNFIELIRPCHAAAATLFILAAFAAAAYALPDLFGLETWPAMLALPIVAALSLTLYFRARLGGTTGDTLGAVGECVETLVLAAAASLCR
jgi:adenosylcobinamide-GDP ribazoletransferase